MNSVNVHIYCSEEQYREQVFEYIKNDTKLQNMYKEYLFENMIKKDIDNKQEPVKNKEKQIIINTPISYASVCNKQGIN